MSERERPSRIDDPGAFRPFGDLGAQVREAEPIIAVERGKVVKTTIDPNTGTPAVDPKTGEPELVKRDRQRLPKSKAKMVEERNRRGRAAKKAKRKKGR